MASYAAYSLSPADVQGNLNELKSAGIIDEIPEPKENTVHVFMITKEEWEEIKNKKVGTE